VNEWGGQPLPLSATAYAKGVLHVRFSGAAPAVESACAKLGGAVVATAPRSGTPCASRASPFRRGAPAGASLWRLSVRSTAPYADLAGEQLIEWGGALRWLVGGARTDSARVRAWAREQAGTRRSRRRRQVGGVFHPLPAPVLALHERLKAGFDPHGILNPGRFYASL